jgi:serine/threonine protein kinase
VTGRLPLNATSDFVLMRKHIDDDPVPPSELVPDLPEALNDLIGDLLRKSPDDRPESAEALHARLRELVPRDTEEQANAHAARIVERARAEADALYERARREVAELFRAARERADELVRSAEEQIPESRAAAEALLSEANPYADFSPFWFAVPVTRPLYAEDGSPTPMAKLAPGTWYLAVEQRGQALVAQTQDGRRGILRDTSGIQRG